MTDVEILLSDTVSEKEELEAINRMIETYNLPLTQNEIMQVFRRARKNIKYVYDQDFKYLKYKFLFDTLLNSNKGMLIAIIRTNIYGYRKIFNHFHIICLVEIIGCSYYIGSAWPFNDSSLKIYCELLDHYDFNVDDLMIPEKYKQQIREYRNEKYCGKLTKPAKYITPKHN